MNYTIIKGIKMKTENELNALKQECESFKSKVSELSDDELKVVTGGSYYETVYHKNKEDVSYILNVGDEVEVYCGLFWGTVRCRIVDRRVIWYETHNTGAPGVWALNISGYRDEYLVQEIKDHWYFFLNNAWLPREYIEK